MSDISKQIVALLVTKDLYKAKLLISESLNQKIGLLLEEKLISYAPTIHSSNLFEGDGDAVAGGIYPTRPRADAIKAAAAAINYDDETEVDEKAPYVQPFTYGDMARQAGDGALIKFGTQMIRAPGLVPKVVGGVALLGGAIDAGIQFVTTGQQLGQNSAALAKNEIQKIIQGSKINPAPGSNLSGTNNQDMQAAAINPNYAERDSTAQLSAGMKLAQQFINTVAGGHLVGGGSKLLATKAEAKFLAPYRAEVDAAMEANRVARGSPHVPLKDIPPIVNTQASNMNAELLKQADNPRVLDKFIGVDNRKAIDKIITDYQEIIKTQKVETRSGLVTTPDVRAANNALNRTEMTRDVFGEPVHTTAQKAAAAARAAAQTDIALSTVPFMRAAAPVAQGLLGSAWKKGIVPTAVATEILAPNYMSSINDYINPPATEADLMQKATNDRTIVQLSQQTNSSLPQNNAGMVILQSKNAFGQDIFTNENGVRLYPGSFPRK